MDGLRELFGSDGRVLEDGELVVDAATLTLTMTLAMLTARTI